MLLKLKFICFWARFGTLDSCLMINIINVLQKLPAHVRGRVSAGVSVHVTHRLSGALDVSKRRQSMPVKI